MWILVIVPGQAGVEVMCKPELKVQAHLHQAAESIPELAGEVRDRNGTDHNPPLGHWSKKGNRHDLHSTVHADRLERWTIVIGQRVQPINALLHIAEITTEGGMNPTGMCE